MKGGVDFGFEVIGNAKTYEQAFECVAAGGVAVGVGVAGDGDVRFFAFLPFGRGVYVSATYALRDGALAKAGGGPLAPSGGASATFQPNAQNQQREEVVEKTVALTSLLKLYDPEEQIFETAPAAAE